MDFDRIKIIADYIAILENENAPPLSKAQIVQKIWILAADMGVPEEALEALEDVAFYESDLVVAERAAQAAEDLLRLVSEKGSDLYF